jgi:hypothetical protein
VTETRLYEACVRFLRALKTREGSQGRRGPRSADLRRSCASDSGGGDEALEFLEPVEDYDDLGQS